MKKLFCCFVLMLFILIGQLYGEIIGTWYGISDRLIYEVEFTGCSFSPCLGNSGFVSVGEVGKTKRYYGSYMLDEQVICQFIFCGVT